MRTIWRQFKPSVTAHYPVHGSVYGEAQRLVDEQPIAKRRVWQKHDISTLELAIRDTLNRAQSSGEPEHYLAALILQSPRAVEAQRKMDKHSHGFHDKSARLDELIQFNDTYVNFILALDHSLYLAVNDQTKQLVDAFCKKLKQPSFSNEQWEAITHGLSREIAVYNGAREIGYGAEMTSRQQDAMGVDMIITDPRTSKHLNVDIKTRSSFHFRLLRLTEEGRISEPLREAAEHAGYCMVINGHGAEQVHTTLLRIDEEHFGRIESFRIERLDVLKDVIAEIMRY